MNKKKLTEDMKEQLRALAEVYVEEENPLEEKKEAKNYKAKR